MPYILLYLERQHIAYEKLYLCCLDITVKGIKKAGLRGSVKMI